MMTSVARSHRQYNRPVALWLFGCAAVIYGMILLGGLTRLTESGLSMVDWRPLLGVIPPLGEAAWRATFERYQAFPEYQQLRVGMSLAEFKVIFLYEYLHRMLGRLIGVLFLLPFLYFALRRRLDRGLTPRLLLLFALGGCQGLLGWYMVQSGLVDDPRVSQYRLTAHLGLAVAIYGYMLWLALGLWRSAPLRVGPARQLAPWGFALCSLVYLMILSGGFVAGTDAGYSYPTWPNMGPGLVPEGLYATSPGWLAAFEDVTTIQFNHRLLAYCLVVAVALFVWQGWRRATTAALRRGLMLLGFTVLLQATLGVSTLLTHVAIPVAAAHQAGAIALLTFAIFCTHQACFGLAAPVRNTAGLPLAGTRDGRVPQLAL